jgi:hypothetical protein
MLGKTAEWVTERTMARPSKVVHQVKTQMTHDVHRGSYGYGAASLSGELKTF